METIRAWRIQSLIETLESLARDNRANQNLNLGDRLQGYHEGRASAQEQTARWLREALATAGMRVA